MKNKDLLQIKNLSYQLEGNPVLNGVNLVIEYGSKNLLMGPNGVGKSSLVNAIIGTHSDAAVSGEILFEGNEISDTSIEDRAKLGIFVGFQNPPQIPGVSYIDLLYEIHKTNKVKDVLTFDSFIDYVESVMDELGINRDLLNKKVNENLSGGEKKKMELLQMVIIQPKLAILDEPDSGLDLDSVSIVEKAIDKLNDSSVFLISHNIANLVNIDFDQVLIIRCCGVLEKGGDDLIKQISNNGYGKGR